MVQASTGSALEEHYRYCESQVKTASKAIWLATLFAPADKRPAFHALDAFALEIGSIRHKVREPMAGELRMQWWADAIEGEARGDLRGHPIAAALLDTVRVHDLPRAALVGFIDVMRMDLYKDPVPDLASFDRRADDTDGALIGLKIRVLCAHISDALNEASRHGGRAIAVLAFLRDMAESNAPPHFPVAMLHGKAGAGADIERRISTEAVQAVLRRLVDHARSELHSLRGLQASLDRAAAPAFLSVSLVAPTLRLVDRRFDPFKSGLSLPQWRVQWILWRAARNRTLQAH